MEIEIYFDIVSNDGVTVGVGATATLSGSYIPADFHHDIEDEREIDVTEVNLFDEDGEEMNSEKLTQIVYEHIDDNLANIFEKAVYKHIDEIYLDDFKSDQDYAELI
jgi:alpha-tubulin suppressor-like RCC1 family protein